MEGNFNPAANAAQEQNANGFAPAEQKAIEYFKKDKNGKWAISEELRKSIEEKAREIMQKNNLRKVFPVVVKGEEGDAKPVYVAYFKRPDMATYSRFMATVQNDEVTASMMLAQNSIVGGDAELVNDEDLFVFGTMNQLTSVVQSRSGEVVKLQSVGK